MIVAPGSEKEEPSQELEDKIESLTKELSSLINEAGIHGREELRDFAVSLIQGETETTFIEEPPQEDATKQELADFLQSRMYRHPRVARMGAKAERILADLWGAYAGDERLLPVRELDRAPGEPMERAIADYLAGMTDRFAMDEHRKLFDPHAHV